MGQAGYRQLWRVVNGAVTDAFNRHPNYLTRSGRKYATTSIVKRVTGTVLSFAVEQTARSRVKAAVRDAGEYSVSAPVADDVAVIRLHSYAHVNERCYQAIRHALFPVGRREVRKDAKRFKSALNDTTKRLRSELAANNNTDLADAIQATREEGGFEKAWRLGGWDGLKYPSMAVSPLKVGKA